MPKRDRVLGISEQAVTSLGSILVLFAAAQGLSADDVGTFSLVVATALLLQSLARAMTGEVLLVEQIRDRDYLMTSAVVVIAIAVLPATIAVEYFMLGDIFIAIAGGTFMVFALLQDCMRFVWIKRMEAKRVLYYSIIANLAQGALVLLASTLMNDVLAVVLAAVLPLMLLCFWHAHRFFVGLSVSAGVRWLRSSRNAGSAYVTEVLSGAIVGYSITLLLAAYESPASVAAFRATVSLFGLTSVLINFARASILRDLATEISHLSRRKTLNTYLSMSIFFGLGVLLAYAFLSLLPDSVGLTLLGQVWPSVVPLLFLGMLDRLLACLSVIPTILLRASGVTWKATGTRLSVAAIGICVSPFAIAHDGSRGAFAAEILTYGLLTIALTAVVWRQTNTKSGSVRFG